MLEGIKEILPVIVKNRVLIFGTNVGGAFTLAEDFQTYLEQKDIPEPSVEVLRDASRIEEAILGGKTIGEGREKPNLPKGVILLPEMRQRSPSGIGMSLNSYESGISDLVEELCKRYGVPLIEIREYNSSKQIEEGLRELLEDTPH